MMSVMWRKFPLTEVVMPSNSNKASSDAGPELASRESHEAMESPEALMCPLEKGVRGIETGHQMPGRSRRAGKAVRRWKARRP